MNSILYRPILWHRIKLLGLRLFILKTVVVLCQCPTRLVTGIVGVPGDVPILMELCYSACRMTESCTAYEPGKTWCER